MKKLRKNMHRLWRLVAEGYICPRNMKLKIYSFFQKIGIILENYRIGCDSLLQRKTHTYYLGVIDLNLPLI